MPTPSIPATQSASLTALTAKLPAGDSKPPADMEATAAMSFAAHFQRFAAKQAGIDVAMPLPEELAEITEDLGNEPKFSLSFLDAVGLPQQHAPASTVPSDEPRSLSATMMVSDAGAGTLAVPFTPPSSAANPAAFTDSAAVSSSPLPAGQHEPVSSVMPDPSIPAKIESANVSSTGREFASHLTSAVTAAHESQSPGAIAAAVQQVVTNLSPAQTANAHNGLTIAQPVGTPGWSDEVGNRIVWIAGQGRSQAELVLNPPQMGRIEVNLSLNGDQAVASFASPNPVVRELLEAALPRLREVLADAGIQLGQAQVGAEHAQHQARHEKHGENPASDLNGMVSTNAASSTAGSGSLSTLATLKSGRGLVDVFA